MFSSVLLHKITAIVASGFFTAQPSIKFPALPSGAEGIIPVERSHDILVAFGSMNLEKCPSVPSYTDSMKNI